MRQKRTSRHKLVSTQLMHLHTVGEPLLRDFDGIAEAEEYATELCRKGHVLEADIGWDGIKQGQKS